MIPMADGTKKPIEEVVVGDQVRTDSGSSSKVLVTKHWTMPLERKTIPYCVDGVVTVSRNHTVKKDGKYFKAADVGVIVDWKEATIDYYHIKTENWLTDFIPFSEHVSAEVWDGYNWDDPKQFEKYVWLQDNKSKELKKYSRLL
jgi:hypothetical protein